MPGNEPVSITGCTIHSQLNIIPITPLAVHSHQLLKNDLIIANFCSPLPSLLLNIPHNTPAHHSLHLHNRLRKSCQPKCLHGARPPRRVPLKRSHNHIHRLDAGTRWPNNDGLQPLKSVRTRNRRSCARSARAMRTCQDLMWDDSASRHIDPSGVCIVGGRAPPHLWREVMERA